MIPSCRGGGGIANRGAAPHPLGVMGTPRRDAALGAATLVNVARDGGVHAFILDTVVAPHRRANGVGAALIATGGHEARAADCAWLHADFEEHLRPWLTVRQGPVPSRPAVRPDPPARGAARPPR
ncbi:hypothetical protein GCM10010103_57190 [Streptomyces paradoxus]